jgi:hypothetical protein
VYEKIEKYLLEKGRITIPEVQKEFSLDYSTARLIFSKLVENKAATLVDGLYYQSEKENSVRSRRGGSSIQRFKEKLQAAKEEKEKSEKEESSKKDEDDKWIYDLLDETDKEEEKEETTEETKETKETDLETEEGEDEE